MKIVSRKNAKRVQGIERVFIFLVGGVKKKEKYRESF